MTSPAPRFDASTLTRLRIVAGESINQLAKRAGVSVSGLASIERGENEPRPATVKKLADALAVDVADLWIYDKEKAS